MQEELKKYIQLSGWCTILIFMASCFFSQNEIVELYCKEEIWEAIKILVDHAGKAVGITFIIMGLFEKYAWKWPVIRLLHDRPVLFPRYQGTFVSDYDQQKRKGVLLIKQTFLSVSIVFRTEESKSRSINGTIVKSHGGLMLVYTYQNDPKANIQERSPVHYGTVMLDVSNTKHIEGNYFTGRSSCGSMDFTAKDKN